MTISAFLLRVILLALPGIAGRMVFNKLAGRRQRKNWEELCEIILFSLICYGLYALGVWIISLMGIHIKLVFPEAIFNEKTPIDWSEVAIVSMVSIPVAFLASLIYTQKIVNRLGCRLGVTKRYGDEDVWDYFHNNPQIEWVFVRDHKVNLIYYGVIDVYSDSEKERELILRKVDVLDNETGDTLYNVEVMYVCRDKHDLTIEAPVLFDADVDKTKGKKEVTENGGKD